jgi:hypothetical protein
MMIPSSKCRPRNSSGRCLVKVSPYQIGPRCLQQSPLTSFRNAEFMVNELRVPVPQEYMERMRAAENAEAARAEGIAIARQMVERVRPMVAGVQLSLLSAVIKWPSM